MLGKVPTSFKALAHKAAHLNSASQRAALGALVLRGEIAVTRPTIAVVSVTVGASPGSIGKLQSRSTAECWAMLGGSLTLADLAEEERAVRTNGNGDDSHSGDADTAEILGGPQSSVDDLLRRYQAMTPAEKIAFGRRIGVERVWLPRRHRHNGHLTA